MSKRLVLFVISLIFALSVCSATAKASSLLAYTDDLYTNPEFTKDGDHIQALRIQHDIGGLATMGDEIQKTWKIQPSKNYYFSLSSDVSTLCVYNR